MSGSTDKVAILSIVASGATAAFTSAMITYDWDTSPSNRAQNNENVAIYGFVPDQATPRALCFVAMFTLTFAHTLARTFSCALLMASNASYLMYYLVGDMALFYLVKIVRGDLRYHVDGDAVASFLMTLFIRFAAKIMMDFTALMQMRHPCECGGMIWSLSLVFALVSCFACGWVYVQDDGSEGGNRLRGGLVWTLISGLSGLFVASSLVFLAVINREFMHTFTSTDTAATYNRKWFTGIGDGDDESKSQVFGVHPLGRMSFEKEIRAWTMNGWERFEQEKPAWFTDR